MNMEKLFTEITKLNYSDITELVTDSIKIYKKEWRGGLIKEIGGPAIIIGDVHGDYLTLVEILRKNDILNFLATGGKFISLGDIIDRGPQQIESINIILWLKVNYPTQVFFLRGNHEPPPGLPVYPHDFPYILKYKFGEKGSQLYNLYYTLFQILPHVLITKNKFFLVHGGIPPQPIEIEKLKNPTLKILEYLLWSDPFEGAGSMISMRGAGHQFGYDITEKFLNKNKLVAIIRGHEPCEGYKFNHNNLVLTLFSRVGDPYFNFTAGYLRLSLDDYIEPDQLSNYIGVIQRL